MRKKDWMPIMPMNLQLFAEEADPAAGDPGEDAGGEPNDSDGKAQEGKKAGAELSRLVAVETRKSVEKLLRDAGITPGDNPEMQLKEYKKWLDERKTELEKAQGDVTTLTEERDKLAAQILQLERKMLAMERHIPADKAEKYINLAASYLGKDEDFGKALDAALVDFPLPAGKKGSAGAGANPGDKGKAEENAANPGAEAAKRRREQQRRSADALKQYEGKP